MENSHEEEMDLKDLIYAVCKAWRKVLIIGIIFAIAFGTYKGLPALKLVNDNANKEENQLAYEESLKDYETKLEIYTEEKRNIEEEIDRKQIYLDSSLLMQIDPYEVTYSALDYYIVSETYNFSILNYYVNYVKSSELYQDILNKCNIDADIKYFMEVLTISADYDSNMLSIRLKYNDKDISNEIIQQVKESLNAKYLQIQGAVGNHIFNLVNESNAQTIDLSLQTNKDSYIDSLVELRSSLEAKEAEISTLTKPDFNIISYSSALKSVIKYVVIGGVIGVFFAATCIIFAYISSDKLQDKKRIKSRFKLKILGDYAIDKEGKVFSFIDRYIAKCFGQGPNTLNKIDITDIVITNISLILKSDESIKRILITSSILEEVEQKNIFNDFKNDHRLKNINIQYGNNIGTSASTLINAADSDAVILIEKKKSSSLSKIEQEIETINDLDKKVIGVILL